MNEIRNFCIIAHIDHGKSTLADRLLEMTGTIEKRKMQDQMLDQMELERERGITIKLQPVRMEYKDFILNLIDTPGHVDFTYEVSRSLAAVEGAILLVDATKGVQAQTIANLRLAQAQNLKIIPAINKIDLQNARMEEVEKEIRSILNIGTKDILKISGKEGTNVDRVLDKIISDIPPPRGSEDKPFKALIFDSAFDAFKGVIAFVRVIDGKCRSQEHFNLSATKAKGEVLEVGYFLPKLSKKDMLKAGDMGYIATGFKDPSLIRVGDTLSVGKTVPLPGYKEPLPVVFASFYSEDSDQFDDLRDALAKLHLTDSSLSYEPETSTALGRGFRVGFLGMLHVEIISERLKREFKLSLIISSPSVEHRVKIRDKEELLIHSASELEPDLQVEMIEEPIVALEIITPVSYMGGVMQMMKNARSTYESTNYLSPNVVELKYKAPLSEIITDFYDKLKSVSSGYASMSYEPIGYAPSDLVRLDVLVAGDLVEPFSRIVPRNRAYHVGKSIISKLKEVVPAQLFDVSLQAAIGGKIIARENIRAMRKDVTGYLYGGDVTRKKKLLEKQKRGKKRMKTEGRVSIPQSVFLEMIKK